MDAVKKDMQRLVVINGAARDRARRKQMKHCDNPTEDDEEVDDDLYC